MSSPPTPASTEFRSYRRFVTRFVLLFVSLGSLYLLVSVGVSIHHRRNLVPTREPVGSPMTASEVRGCYDELEDVEQGLRKHLENFHHLLASYNIEEAQRWADEGSVWKRQWNDLGRRCRFSDIRRTPLSKELEEMAVTHDELGETQLVYTNALLRFGKDQAPRLDRLRARMQRVGERLNQKTIAPTAPTGDTKQ